METYNLLLIDKYVQNYEIFYDNCNTVTHPLLDFNRDAILENLAHITEISRICIVANDSKLDDNKIFLNNEPYFTLDDINEKGRSSNLQFLIDLIKNKNVKHIDFLACNSLNYEMWSKYYALLTTLTGVIIGASDNKTGNIKYGGDWVMESTKEDIQNIYFTTGISNYMETLLATTISGDGTLDLDFSLLTFPVTIKSTNTSSRFTVKLTTNINLNNYFIIPALGVDNLANNVCFDGSGYTVTCTGTSYAGLIQSSSLLTLIKNVGIDGRYCGNLADYCGWLAWGDKLTGFNGSIQTCYSYGDITGKGSGGIVGANATGSINLCFSSGDIIGAGAGGIAGYYSKYLTVENCYSIGTIAGLGSGGITGAFTGVDGLCTVQNCYSNGNIGQDAGGIAGAYCGNCGMCLISNCYSTGNLQTNVSGGGICGYRAGKYGKCTIQYCYSSHISNIVPTDNSAIINTCAYSSTWSDSTASVLLLTQDNVWQKLAGHPWKLKAFLNLINKVYISSGSYIDIKLISILPLTPNPNVVKVGLVNINGVSKSSLTDTTINPKSVFLSGIIESDLLYLVYYDGVMPPNIIEYANIYYSYINSSGTILFDSKYYLYPVILKSTSFTSPLTIKFKENMNECRFIIPNTSSDNTTQNNVTVDGSGCTINFDTIQIKGVVSSYSNNTIVKNIGVIPSISSYLQPYGGWVCSSGFRGSVIDCYSTGPIDSYGCGGIVGGYSTCKITGCYSTGIIGVLISEDFYLNLAGGIIGAYSYDSYISRCYSVGNIGIASGGIVGGYSSNMDIRYCYSRGNIADNVIYAGGIMGISASGSVIITGCYITGSLNNSAGICAYTNNLDSIINISGCYVASSVIHSISHAFNDPSNTVTVTSSLYTYGWSDAAAASILTNDVIWKSIQGNPWKLRRFLDNVNVTVNGNSLTYTNTLPINSYSSASKAKLSTGEASVNISLAQKQITIPITYPSSNFILQMLDSNNIIIDYTDYTGIGKTDIINGSDTINSINFSTSKYYSPVTLKSKDNVTPLTINISAYVSNVKFYIPALSLNGSANYVIIDGLLNTAVVTDAYYNGLVRSESQNTIVKNICVSSNVLLDDYNGWIGWGSQYVDGFKGTIINCSSRGNITGTYSGGIVGRKARANISKSSSTGTISGTGSGGIAGGACDCTITDCYTNGDISGASAGGIIGYNTGVDVSTNITSCYSTGIIRGVNAGGIVGQNMNKGYINKCYSTGLITGAISGGIVGAYFTGITGEISSNIVKNCYSTGDISGSGAGGICGANTGSVGQCNILSCYSTGGIKQINCGGIVGNTTSDNCKLKSCYVVGTVTGSNSGVFKPAGAGSLATVDASCGYSAGWFDVSAQRVFGNDYAWKRMTASLAAGRPWKLHTFLDNVRTTVINNTLTYTSDFPLNSYSNASRARLIINGISVSADLNLDTKSITWALTGIDISATQSLTLRLDTISGVVVDYANDFSYNNTISGSGEQVINDVTNYVSPIIVQSTSSSSRLTVKINCDIGNMQFYAPALSRDNTQNSVTIDGSGHIISGAGIVYSGIVKSDSSGTIVQNFGFQTTGCILSSYCGWITNGELNNGFAGTVQYCYAIGKELGSLLGDYAGSGSYYSVLNCYNNAGSIVGNYSSPTVKSSITNCYSTRIGGAGGGGIIGTDANNVNIFSCFYIGELESAYYSGIVGPKSGSLVNITKCYCIATKISNYCAGIAGQQASCKILNCYSIFNIDNNLSYCGGITSIISTAACTISGCYVIGNLVDYTSNSNGTYKPAGTGNAIITNCITSHSWSDASANGLLYDASWTQIASGYPYKLKAFVNITHKYSNGGLTYYNDFFPINTYPNFKYAQVIQSGSGQSQQYNINVNDNILTIPQIDAFIKSSNGTDVTLRVYTSTAYDIVNITSVYSTNISGTGTIILTNANDYIYPVTISTPGSTGSLIVKMSTDWSGYNINFIISSPNITFDGSGYTITINYNGYQGLINSNQNSTLVKNIGVISNSTLAQNAGWIGCAYFNGTVDSCYSTGNMTYLNGGILGYTTSCNISNCYSTGDIGELCGGIIYQGQGQGIIIINNCYSTGSILGRYAGGIACTMYNNCIIQNCYSTGAISGYYSGGLSYYILSESVNGTPINNKIINCYVTGKVTGQGAGVYQSQFSNKIPTNCANSIGWKDETAMVLYSPNIWRTMNGYPWKLNAFLKDVSISGGKYTSKFPIYHTVGTAAIIFKNGMNTAPIDIITRTIEFNTPIVVPSYLALYNNGLLIDYVNNLYDRSLISESGNISIVECIFPVTLVAESYYNKLELTFPYDISGSGYQFIIPSLSKDGTPNNVTIDGNGHKIYIHDNGYNGLFQSQSYNTVIKRIEIMGSGTSQLQDYGGWIGCSGFKGTIIDCSSNNPANSFGSGGIVGANSDSCTITNCYMSGDISGQYAGGIMGYNSSGCTIYGSNSSGLLSGPNAGGILGAQPLNCNVKYCYSTGILSGIGSGGIVGSMSGQRGDCIIIDSYAMGRGITEAGAIAGVNCGSRNGKCLITNCYTSTSGDSWVGWMVPQYAGFNGMIEINNCFSNGLYNGILGPYSGTGYIDAGGSFDVCYCYTNNNLLIGDYSENGKISNCYTLSGNISGSNSSIIASNNYILNGSGWNDISANTILGTSSNWKSIIAGRPWKLSAFLTGGKISYSNNTFIYERKFPFNATVTNLPILNVKLYNNNFVYGNPVQIRNTDKKATFSSVPDIFNGNNIYLVASNLDYIDLIYEYTTDSKTKTNPTYLPPCIITSISAINFAAGMRYLILNAGATNITLPLAAGIPQELSFTGKGIKFTNTANIIVSKYYNYNANYIARAGDIEFTVTFFEL